MIRTLRRRRGWRQVDLARHASLSQIRISVIDRGYLDRLSVHSLRSVLAALDASATLDLRWRGGELDRLADAGHASLVEHLARWLGKAGWTCSVEITYSSFGERGSIDILAFHGPSRWLPV